MNGIYKEAVISWRNEGKKIMENACAWSRREWKTQSHHRITEQTNNSLYSLLFGWLFPYSFRDVWDMAYTYFFLLLLLASSACLFSSRLLKNGCMRLPTFPLPHALILCVCVCLVLNATLLFCFGSMRSNSFECIIKNWNVAKTTPLNRRNTCCINGQRECGKKSGLWTKCLYAHLCCFLAWVEIIPYLTTGFHHCNNIGTSYVAVMSISH